MLAMRQPILISHCFSNGITSLKSVMCCPDLPEKRHVRPFSKFNSAFSAAAERNKIEMQNYEHTGKVSPEPGKQSSPSFVKKKGTVCNSHCVYGEYIHKHVPKLHSGIRLLKVCRECVNGYDLIGSQFSYVIPIKYSSSSHDGCYPYEIRELDDP